MWIMELCGGPIVIHILFQSLTIRTVLDCRVDDLEFVVVNMSNFKIKRL